MRKNSSGRWVCPISGTPYPSQLSGGQKQRIAIARTLAKVVFMADGIIQKSGTPEMLFEHPQSERLVNFLGKVLLTPSTARPLLYRGVS